MKELIRHILREHTKEIGEQRIPKWNLENLKKEALKYNTEKDFIKFSNSAYQTARRLGVLDQILSHVQRNVRRKYTKEEITQEALKYKTRNAFKIGSFPYYRAALKYGWIDDVTQHMMPSYETWTKDDVMKIASQFTNRDEFRKNNSKAYAAAHYNGWLEDVTKHMEYLGSHSRRLVYVYEFPDNFAYIGLTYNKDRRDDSHMKLGPVFNHMNETGLVPKRVLISGYIDAQDASNLEKETAKKYYEKGWSILNSARPGTLGGALIWTLTKVKKEASKYDNIGEFRRNSFPAYSAAKRNGWISELNLEDTDFKWTLDKVRKEAEKYTTMNDFIRGSKRAYNAAYYHRKKGWLDNIKSFFLTKKQDMDSNQFNTGVVD